MSPNNAPVTAGRSLLSTTQNSTECKNPNAGRNPQTAKPLNPKTPTLDPTPTPYYTHLGHTHLLAQLGELRLTPERDLRANTYTADFFGSGTRDVPRRLQRGVSRLGLFGDLGLRGLAGLGTVGLGGFRA